MRFIPDIIPFIERPDRFYLDGYLILEKQEK